MPKHYVRDVRLSVTADFDTYGNVPDMNTILFHFLRVAGWTHIWSCDGETNATNANHVPDGNMEDSGVASYTVVGTATLSKVTTPKRSGTRALRVQTSATNDGATTTALTSMSNSTVYRIMLYASNDSGVAWDVLVDDGSGSFSSVGSIPDNSGTWTLYEFNFTSHTSGSRYIRVQNDAGSGGEEIYLDGLHVYKSWWEHNVMASGTDGIVTYPNLFSTAGSYTPGAPDVNKFVFVFDPTNPKNSGCYLAVSHDGAGSLYLNLRGATATFTTQGGLTYRIVDVVGACPDDASDNSQKTAGFGLESPDSTNWRFFLRQNMIVGQNPKPAAIWVAPADTDFDISSGTFYKTGPSTQRSKQGDFTVGSASNTHLWKGPYSYTATNWLTRSFIMLDEDGRWFTFVHYDATFGEHGCLFAGFAGTDSYHPGIEEFALFCRFGDQTSEVNEIEFKDGTGRFSRYGTTFNPDGLTEDCCIGVLGYGSGTANVMTQTNAGPNRWSSDEHVMRPEIVRNPDQLGGDASERTLSVGLYQGRTNLPTLATFDSANYIHFATGLVWDWMGESLAP